MKSSKDDVLSTLPKNYFIKCIRNHSEFNITQSFITNNLQFKLASPITVLRAEPNDKEFAHIISCRRQVYVSNFEDVKHLTNCTLTYNGHNHHIFINHDDPTCLSANHPITNLQIARNSKESLTKIENEIPLYKLILTKINNQIHHRKLMISISPLMRMRTLTHMKTSPSISKCKKPATNEKKFV